MWYMHLSSLEDDELFLIRSAVWSYQYRNLLQQPVHFGDGFLAKRKKVFFFYIDDKKKKGFIFSRIIQLQFCSLLCTIRKFQQTYNRIILRCFVLEDGLMKCSPKNFNRLCIIIQGLLTNYPNHMAHRMAFCLWTETVNLHVLNVDESELKWTLPMPIYSCIYTCTEMCLDLFSDKQLLHEHVSTGGCG